MKPFKSITKLLIFFPYYIFHCNIFFGLLFKIFYNKFNYKNIKININVEKIKLSQLSSFLFKTYELNDRILIERFVSNKNKSIIIGAGLGFIASITYKKSVEGFGISFIEAASYGVGSIGGKDGGAEDAIKNNETGLLCDGQDISAIYNSIIEFFKNDNYKRFGSNAMKFSENFTWKKIIRQYLNLI